MPGPSGRGAGTPVQEITQTLTRSYLRSSFGVGPVRQYGARWLATLLTERGPAGALLEAAMSSQEARMLACLERMQARGEDMSFFFS